MLLCVLLAGFGVGLAFFLSDWMQRREDRLLVSRFTSEAKDRVVAIDRTVHEKLASVESVAAFLQTTEIDRGQFHEFTRRLLDRDAGLQGFGWNPIVRHEDRTRHEEATRREGFPGYEIVEAGLWNDREMVRAGDRPEYVVVHFLEPFVGNEKALGYDISSELVRRSALERTRESGATTATGVLRLVQDPSPQAGALVCAPVYESDGAGSDLAGFAVGILRIRTIVESVLAGFERGSVELSLTDTGTVGGGLLYGSATACAPGASPDDLRFATTIRFAGREWRAECVPTPGFLADESVWGSTVMLWAVLLLTLGLTGFVWHLFGSNERLRLQVAENQRTRAELEATQEWMELALGALDGGVWDLDPERGAMHFSRGWEEMLGYSSGELPRRLSAWEDRVHPDDRARVQRARQEQLEGAWHPVSLEYRMQTKDGEWIWVLDRSRVIERSAGDCAAHVTGTTLDITQRKMAEESMLQLNFAVENAMTGISRLDPEGRFVMVRAGYARMLGYEPEEMIGMSWQQTVQPDDVDKCVAAYGTMLAEGRSDTVANARRKDGSTFVKHILLVRIDDGSGEQAGHYCFMRDVTEASEAEAAVRLRDRAIRSVSNGIVITDALQPDNPIVFVNEAFERMTGYTAAEAVGRNCRFLQGDDREQPGLDELRRAMREQREAKVLLRNYRRDGAMFWNELVVAPVLDTDGRLTHFVGAQTDVTAREEAARERTRFEADLRQSQKLEAVGTLASGIAHDFNNLLTAIGGHTARASEQVGPDHPARESLQLVGQACEQANVVARSLLTFSTRSDVDREPVELVAVARDSIRLMRHLLPASIELGQSFPDREVWVEGDSYQLQQVLINLTINARDAMPAGGRLDFALETCVGTCAPPGHAVLTITDTGCGMAAETSARIFEPFFTTKERGKGTGLGLSVVHGIVKDHGGRIDVRSEPGRGTSVRLELPRRAEEAPAPALVDGEPVGRSCAGNGELILVAEDNELVRPLIVAALERDGYEVVCATDGDEALRLFDEHRDAVRLLVLDLDLPKKSGVECIAAIHAVRPEIPALIVTGACDHVIAQGCESNQRVLAKPFGSRELQTVVGELVAVTRAC